MDDEEGETKTESDAQQQRSEKKKQYKQNVVLNRLYALCVCLVDFSHFNAHAITEYTHDRPMARDFREYLRLHFCYFHVASCVGIF